MLSADLFANLIHTAYEIFSHNYILFSYLAGAAIALFLAIRRPSRFALLLLLGFLILSFSFEYDKHIAEGLREQTLSSLIRGEPHLRTERWVDIIVGEILPVAFHIGGWFLIYLALLIGGSRRSSDMR